MISKRMREVGSFSTDWPPCCLYVNPFETIRNIFVRRVNQNAAVNESKMDLVAHIRQE